MELCLCLCLNTSNNNHEDVISSIFGLIYVLLQSSFAVYKIELFQIVLLMVSTIQYHGYPPGPWNHPPYL